MSNSIVEAKHRKILPVFVPSLENGQIYMDPCPHIYRWLLRIEFEERIPSCGKSLVTTNFDSQSSLCIVQCRKCELLPLNRIEVLWIVVPIKLFLKVTEISTKDIKAHSNIILPPPLSIYEIDRSGYHLIANSLYKHILQQEAMTWLSTLGGGFSCLGDRFEDAAEIAGQISLRQMCLALAMKIPVFQARCRLFYAQSLMQRGRLNAAACMIRDVYIFSKTASAVDNPPEVRLSLMCQGLWKRLSYLWALRKESRVEFRRRGEISQKPYTTASCGRRLYKDVSAILSII
ncbi:unnamed protein product [Hymenolepis diminuta]|uniref:Uncharacterized protein n=1 Tax=Hymenolepis diminuta TaxID=6216 RepID=A0A564ZEC6_HYMDI|nr:unnamed protein product [Hymenolepis diminuta]